MSDTRDGVPGAVLDREMNLAELRSALERERQRNQPHAVGRVPVDTALGKLSMNELALRAVMAQHNITRPQAQRVLDAAKAEAEAAKLVQAEREEAEREERRAQRLEKAFRATGIAPRAELVPAIVRGTIDETEALRLTRSWMNGPRRFIGLFGDSGTGKTVAISVAAVDALRQRIAVRHVLESQLVELKRGTTNTAREELADIQNHRGLLVVEEAGQTLAADAEIAGLVVAQIHNARIAMPDCRMAQLGNISTQAAVQRYGTRWADRMREVGRVHELKLAAGERSMRVQPARSAT